MATEFDTKRNTKNNTKHKHQPKHGVKNKPTFKNPNKTPLGDNRVKKKEKHENPTKPTEKSKDSLTSTVCIGSLPASEQLCFFLNRFQAGTGAKLSSLELEPLKDTCILELTQGMDQDDGDLSKHMKSAFGKSWKEVLYDGQLLDGNVDPGNPAVLVISTSAIRSLELLRGLRPLTKECHAAKLFAKHMKVEDQVSMLNGRVNFANGTPSRIKKLIDMEALGLSRLSVIVLDMHTDAKGYSLFTLPQVSGEFWDLYKSHFQDRIIQGDLRMCLYGPKSHVTETKRTYNHDT